MKAPTMVLVCLLCACLHAAAAEALLVSLSPHEVEEALRQGREKGDQAAEYVNRIYGFGKEDRHGENGIIRTKWSKLMVLSGLLAARGGKPSEEDLNGIITSTDLQIDLHAFGDRMGFADSYTTYLVQSGRRVDPEKIAADDVVYPAGDGAAVSGFPRYHATVRSYFLYDKINPADRAEIVLVKNKKKVSFEVNLADYK